MSSAATGDVLENDYSNRVWQCAHTLLDTVLVDRHGNLVSRPWLTTMIDTYSRAILGFHLGYDEPSSQVVALALRHAILPKQYGPEYNFCAYWPACGIPDHLLADVGKDSGHDELQQIGAQLGFSCYLNAHSSKSEIVKRSVSSLDTQSFPTFPENKSSNVQEPISEAEREARLTFDELEKLLAAHIVNSHNHRSDTGVGDQTRIQRWDAGLLKKPSPISEQELDACLGR